MLFAPIGVRFKHTRDFSYVPQLLQICDLLETMSAYMTINKIVFHTVFSIMEVLAIHDLVGM
jgi:hypothetical protein